MNDSIYLFSPAWRCPERSANVSMYEIAPIVACYVFKTTLNWRHVAPGQRRSEKVSKPAWTCCAATTESVVELSQRADAERLEHLVQQACGALDAAAEFEAPVFPCALIAGDVVILHLLHKQGLLGKGMGA